MQGIIELENSCLNEFVSRGKSVEDFGVVLYCATALRCREALRELESLKDGKRLLRTLVVNAN